VEVVERRSFLSFSSVSQPVRQIGNGTAHLVVLSCRYLSIAVILVMLRLKQQFAFFGG